MITNLKKVTVRFFYEGESYPADVAPGALNLETGRVLVDTDCVSLYDCMPSEDEPGVYIVNLDVWDRDYLYGKGESALVDYLTR